MNYSVDRRRFLATSAAAGVAAMMTTRSVKAQPVRTQPYKTKLRKSLIGGANEKTLATVKAAGFEGIETGSWNTTPEKAAEARKTAEKLGMHIHSVLRGWTNFNNDSRVEGDIAGVQTALRAAEAYGADAILLVPCKIGVKSTPQPWEFDIEFDEKTGHISRVVKGDNAPYKEYIDAHNHATDTSRKAIEKIIPTAEKTGVIVALENVWNNLWVQPAIFQNFIASFDSPSIQCYFDIGNHVKYAKPEQWVRTLGKLIVKCHVKDFKLNEDGHGGRFCNIRDGSVDWPLVRKELDALGRDDLWMTIEGSGGLSPQERSERLDLIIAGK